MPKTCIHSERLKEMLDDCRMMKFNSSSPESAFKIMWNWRNGVYDDFVWVNAEFANLLKEIKEIAERCNCDNVDDLKRRIRDLENRVSSAESSSSSQLVLRRNVETERNDLQITKRNLESRVYDLERDRDSWRSSSWSLQAERDSLKEQVREKSELIRSGEVVLRNTQNQLTNTQSQLTTTQNQLTRRNTEYDDLSCRFNNLQIENNNKDNEIKTKEEKIVSLKVKLGEAEEDILCRELVSKEKKLDELTRNLTIEPPQRVKELREAYERLIRAREDYSRDGVAAAQRDIDARKQELLQTDIDVDNLYKVYRNCEKVAELRIKLEKIHEQRFEARQEVPTNN